MSDQSEEIRKVKEMIEFHSTFEKASPEIQSAVRLLLGLAQQPSESPEKN